MARLKPELEEKLQIDSPLKKIVPIVLGVMLSFLIGPYCTDFLSSYRGVILEIKGDTMLVAWGDERPPSWEPYQGHQLGDLIVKKAGSLEVRVESPNSDDAARIQLLERYQSRYSGVVTHLEAPLSRGAPYIAIIQLDSGKEYRHAVWDEELAKMITVGRRVEKVYGTWEPKIVSKTNPAPVQLAPGSSLPKQSK